MYLPEYSLKLYINGVVSGTVASVEPLDLVCVLNQKVRVCFALIKIINEILISLT